MYGCRVIQKVLNNLVYSDSRKIVEYITSSHNFPTLILDQYGNYLIQTIMEISLYAEVKKDKNLLKLYE